MKRETLTSKEVNQVGQDWKQLILASMTLNDVLKRFKPKDVLAQLKPEDVLAQFKPKDVLAQLMPEDVLAHLKREDIENYLIQLKQNHNVPRKPKPRKNGSRA